MRRVLPENVVDMTGPISDTAPDILVVDDSPGIVEAVTQVLDEEGYRVRTAANGREALCRVIERLPDVILLDLMMPIMDGWEFVARLKKLPNGGKPRIVLLSAVRGLELEADGTRADDWLGKPFTVEDLLDKVASALHQVPLTASPS